MLQDSFNANITVLQEEQIALITNVTNLQQLEEVRIKALGKKGCFSELLKELKEIPKEDKSAAGKLLNDAKTKIEILIKEKTEELTLANLEKELALEKIDVSLPGSKCQIGHIHPISKVEEELIEIFESLGFSVEEGPDIESEYNNFEALNIPKYHPARDMQDTFYITDTELLRTHTSPVQIHVMKRMKPPVKMIAPGAVYRHDADTTHSPMFHQIEGLYVDKNVNFGHLKYTLEEFIHRLFGPKTKVRLRPSFFPFTEPSAEVDVSCVICKGAGCRVCSMTGWLEILGAGMVNPKVFEHVGYDSEEYTGFAFGLGIERITMLKYGIDDIRLFFENDDRFLKQF